MTMAMPMFSFITSPSRPSSKRRALMIVGNDVFSRWSDFVGSQDRLSTVEAFGQSRRRIRLQATKTQRRHEQISCEPALAALTPVTGKNDVDLPLADRFRQRREQPGRSEVTVVFRNLVFQDEVVAERVPGQLRNRAVVLVQVLPVMREHEVRKYVPLQVLEAFFYRGTLVGKETVGELVNRHAFFASAEEKAPSSQARFLGAQRRRTEHDPVHRQAGVLFQQAKQRSAASDLDVVAMGSQAEHHSQIPGVSAQADREHDARPQQPSPPKPWRSSSATLPRAFQTCHGAVPCSYIWSKVILSLKVSIASQKPSCL